MQTQPIDFHPPTSEAPPILLPVAGSLFADRAERFATLAVDHSVGDWLAFLGQLSRAQHDTLRGFPTLPLPTPAMLDTASRHGMPPLDPGGQRPAEWRAVLRRLAGDPGLIALAPAAARQALDALLLADDRRLEALAEALFAGTAQPADLAELPFVAAALQATYTALAGQLPAAAVQRLDTPGLCPCCGSPPVASVVRLGAEINNLRYLHCSLCNTEWNVPRAVCTSCADDKAVALHQVDGSSGAVRAETCDACKSYLKVVYQDKDPRVDPVADDLATLALDLLVDEAGYLRSGPNFFLLGAQPADLTVDA